jgi:60 kDa SS-A/Ro ribonucleoprotein
MMPSAHAATLHTPNQLRTDVGTFVVLTDSEAWFGAVHPAERCGATARGMGIPARLVVVGMVANRFSIADPADGGMLDVVGFDTAVPQLMRDFAAG